MYNRAGGKRNETEEQERRADHREREREEEEKEQKGGKENSCALAPPRWTRGLTACPAGSQRAVHHTTLAAYALLRMYTRFADTPLHSSALPPIPRPTPLPGLPSRLARNLAPSW